MNPLLKIKNRIKYYLPLLKFKLRIIKHSIRIVCLKKSKMIYLFGSSGNSNFGDQSQTYCIQKWCEKYLKNYRMFIFQLNKPSMPGMRLTVKILKKFKESGI
ncbi:MAG: hypothetical protein FWF51_06240 [Chitinivibrionia bacterium]|nr:hypothetical protein [Chitinivibrionia bacterium]